MGRQFTQITSLGPGRPRVTSMDFRSSSRSRSPTIEGNFQLGILGKMCWLSPWACGEPVVVGCEEISANVGKNMTKRQYCEMFQPKIAFSQLRKSVFFEPEVFEHFSLGPRGVLQLSDL